MNNMAFFEFNNKKIFYLDEGQGEPLIILNGIMMSTQSWNYLVPTMTSVLRLIRVDFLDQGQSDTCVGEKYTQDLQADVVLALIKHLKLNKVNLFGVSYGGEVALKFAIKHSNLINKLILSNTTAHTNEWLRDIGRGWNEVGRTRNGEAYYNVTIPVIYSPLFYVNNYEWMENRRKLLVPLFSDENFLDRMERLVNSAESLDVRNSLDKINCDTLIISSEYDFITPKHEQLFLKEHIKNSSYIHINDAGHGFMYEKTKLFMALLIGYIFTNEAKV